MFGTTGPCPACGTSIEFDITNLARFRLPSRFEVRVTESDGSPWRGRFIVMDVKHRSTTPPLRTTDSGMLTVPSTFLRRAEDDARETGLSDFRGESMLARYVCFRVLSKELGRKLGMERRGSGWPVLPFEESLYRDMPSLIESYAPDGAESVETTTVFSDLEKSETEIVISVQRR